MGDTENMQTTKLMWTVYLVSCLGRYLAWLQTQLFEHLRIYFYIKESYYIFIGLTYTRKACRSILMNHVQIDCRTIKLTTSVCSKDLPAGSSLFHIAEWIPPVSQTSFGQARPTGPSRIKVRLCQELSPKMSFSGRRVSILRTSAAKDTRRFSVAKEPSSNGKHSSTAD